jgi:hypothetical protein
VKNLAIFLLLVGLASVLAVPASADSITITEGTTNLDLRAVVNPGVLALCDVISPTGGGCATTSDIVLWTPFYLDFGGGLVQVDTIVTFCSDSGDGDNDPNDHGFGGACGSEINWFTQESAADAPGTETTVYLPDATRPGGSSTNDPSLTYNLISDTSAVPEPTSLVLFGSGLLTFVGVIRKRLGN